MNPENMKYVRWFESIGISDIPIVGGKNASLGEMIRSLKPEGIRVPCGFATSAEAFRYFVSANQIGIKIPNIISEWKHGTISLEKAGKAIRRLFLEAEFPTSLATAISESYAELEIRTGKDDVDVAVRSSATAEDLPDAFNARTHH